MKNAMDLGAFIATQRKLKKLTQEGLANLIGVTPQAVSKWENGVGYPDVTLFPHIAKALDVSISELFGEEVNVLTVPKTFRNMPKVYDDGEFVCYSSKKIEKTDKEKKIIYFKDGSIADISEGYIRNVGDGEAVMFSAEAAKEKQTKASNEVVSEINVDSFDSLEIVISGGSNDVTVERGNIPCVIFRGEEDFSKHYSLQVRDGKLSVLQSDQCTKIKKVRMTVKTPFNQGKELKINSNGNSAFDIDVDFDSTYIDFNGNSALDGKNSGDLHLKLKGNSSVEYNRIEKNTDINISGNSSVSVKDTGKTKMDISGNSAISLLNVRDELSVDVSGNSSIFAAGEIDALMCKFRGNGEFDGKRLTVKSADITVVSRGKIYLKHVKKESIERISFDGKLTVEKRG